MTTTPPTADADALLAQLEDTPGDELLRENAARALAARGDFERAYRTLIERLVNVTAHTYNAPLPSLHRRAIEPAVARVEHSGVGYLRDFVCAEGRVLFFWVPESIEHASDEYRKAVRERLTRRFADKNAASDD